MFDNKINSNYFLIILFCIFCLGRGVFAQNGLEEITFPLEENGYIPAWLVAGPFEQPVIIFQGVGDADSISESTIEPFEGKEEIGALTASDRVNWKIQSLNEKNFLDFNASLGWISRGEKPEKTREAKAGYACVYLYSDRQQEVFLLLGSNSRLKIYFNHQLIHQVARERPARADEDTLKIQLAKGKNVLLAKAGNSSLNHYAFFWGGVEWGWGLFARLINPDGSKVDAVNTVLPRRIKKGEIRAESSVFFKTSDSGLEQRIDLEFYWPYKQFSNGYLNLEIGGEDYNYIVDQIKFGENRKSVYISELSQDTVAIISLKAVDKTISGKVILKKQKKYELHLMMLSHMDIGYTNPQPICKERHLKALDDVIEICEIDPEFRWTIETTWILEQYEHARPRLKFEQLINLIKEERISVSPIYANPFTGWISERELLASFTKAGEYTRRYGLKYSGAVYNDTPGLNWSIPKALNMVDAKFLVCGINEVYGGYKIQKTLPKVFNWQGAGGNKVTTYLCEAYAEGRTYGFEGNLESMENRIRVRLQSLETRGYDYDLVMLNSAFTDNAGVPMEQYNNARAWAKNYAYPKVVISNLNLFADRFLNKYREVPPVLLGDWTSDWDILHQGETLRMRQYRDTQSKIVSTEKLAALAWGIQPQYGTFFKKLHEGFKNLLLFSGHGSGLEFGAGTTFENNITFAYRQNYVENAYLNSEEIKLRALYRICDPYTVWGEEGIIVFNTLSWIHDAPVEIEMKEQNLKQYEVYDPGDGSLIPSFRDNYKLRFVARSLPALGYKKYILRSKMNKENVKPTELLMGNDFIENKFYRINIQTNNGNALEIIDKKTGTRLIADNKELPFTRLLRKLLTEKRTKPLDYPVSQIEIFDERPVRLLISIQQPECLLENVEIILWENFDRVDTRYTINLERIKPPETAEEYGIAFPFVQEGPNARVELLGGYLRPDQNEIRIAEHNAYSIRRTVVLDKKNASITWASKNCRIVRLIEHPETKKMTLVANLVNNFPSGWNRREENRGKMVYLFSFTSQSSGFNPSFSSQFGWELFTDPPVYRSLFSNDALEESFLKIENEKVLLAALSPYPEENRLVFVLQNVDPDDSVDSIISSPFFKGKKAYLGDWKFQPCDSNIVNEDQISVQIEANGIEIIIINMGDQDKKN